MIIKTLLGALLLVAATAAFVLGGCGTNSATQKITVKGAVN